MAECLCQCQTFSLVSATPGTTYNFTYNDCNTGVPTTIFVDNDLEPIIHYCYPASNPGIAMTVLSGSFAYTSFVVNQNGFKVINCNDINDFFYTVTDLSAYVNTPQAIQINPSTVCWYVENAIICDENILVTIDNVFTSCEACAEPLPTNWELDFISCCGSRVYFQIPNSLVSSYGNVNDSYFYTGPPTVDLYGVTMYPNQCYWISLKLTPLTGPVRPIAPLPSFFNLLAGSGSTACSTDICSHCFYKLQDCTNPSNILISYSNLAAYLGQTITVNNHPGCWTVSETELTTPTPIEIIPIQGYASCATCLTKGIVFTSCCGFSAYFLLNSSIPYLTEGNVYVYNGAPIADGFGNTLYPNICYSYSTFTTLTGTVTAPALASFTTSLGLTCEAAPCKNCFYKLTNCDNEAQVIYTYSNLSVVVGDSVTINGYPKICWNVEASTTAVNPIAVVIVATYTDCVTCKGYFFTLNDCCTDEPYLINGQPAVLEYHGNANPDFAPGDIVDLIITTVNLENGTSITGCFKIGELTTPPTTQTIIPWDTNTDFVTVPTCDDCQSCQTCYLLTNCATGLVEYITGTDLIQYIGGVITIAGCKDQCWIVTQAENCDGCGGAVEVLTYFPSVVVTPEMCTYTISLTNFASITSATININGTVYPLVATSVTTLISSINALGLGTCYYGGGALPNTVVLGLTGDSTYGTLCVQGT